MRTLDKSDCTHGNPQRREAVYYSSVADCFYHPERPGIGVCMRCRRVICTACCTQLDGVNHCFACIEEIGRPEKSAGAEIAGTLVRVAMLMGGVLFLFLLFWALQTKLAP